MCVWTDQLASRHGNGHLCCADVLLGLRERVREIQIIIYYKREDTYLRRKYSEKTMQMFTWT